MSSLGFFARKEMHLPGEFNDYLSQCLEKGGKVIADTEIGFAKNALKQ